MGDIIKALAEFGKTHGISALLFLVIIVLIVDLIRSSRKNVEEYYKNEIKEVKSMFQEIKTELLELDKSVTAVKTRTDRECTTFFKTTTAQVDIIHDICVRLKEMHDVNVDGTLIWYNSPKWDEKLNNIQKTLNQFTSTSRGED